MLFASPRRRRLTSPHPAIAQLCSAPLAPAESCLSPGRHPPKHSLTLHHRHSGPSLSRKKQWRRHTASAVPAKLPSGSKRPWLSVPAATHFYIHRWPPHDYSAQPAPLPVRNGQWHCRAPVPPASQILPALPWVALAASKLPPVLC